MGAIKISVLFEANRTGLKVVHKGKTPTKLIESLDLKGRLKGLDYAILEGECMDFSVMSENERFYNKESFLEEFFRLSKLAEEGKLYGAADHPDLESDFILKTKEISHIIEKLWYVEEESKCYIRIRVIPTIVGGGFDLLQVIDNGGVLSISSRAIGYFDEETKEAFVDTLFSFDVVGDPGMANSQLRVVDAEGNDLTESVKFVSKKKLLVEAAKSKSQQKLFGQALAIRKGDQDRDGAPQKVLDIVDGDMKVEEIEKFASTSHDDLPNKLAESINNSNNKKEMEGLHELKAGDEINVKLAEGKTAKLKLSEATHKNGGAFYAKGMLENNGPEVEAMYNEHGEEWEEVVEDPIMEMFEALKSKASKKKNVRALVEVKNARKNYRKKLIENAEPAIEIEDEAIDKIEEISEMVDDDTPISTPEEMYEAYRSEMTEKYGEDYVEKMDDEEKTKDVELKEAVDVAAKPEGILESSFVGKKIDLDGGAGKITGEKKVGEEIWLTVEEGGSTYDDVILSKQTMDSYRSGIKEVKSEDGRTIKFLETADYLTEGAGSLVGSGSSWRLNQLSDEITFNSAGTIISIPTDEVVSLINSLEKLKNKPNTSVDKLLGSDKSWELKSGGDEFQIKAGGNAIDVPTDEIGDVITALNKVKTDLKLTEGGNSLLEAYRSEMTEKHGENYGDVMGDEETARMTELREADVADAEAMTEAAMDNWEVKFKKQRIGTTPVSGDPIKVKARGMDHAYKMAAKKIGLGDEWLGLKTEYAKKLTEAVDGGEQSPQEAVDAYQGSMQAKYQTESYEEAEPQMDEEEKVKITELKEAANMAANMGNYQTLMETTDGYEEEMAMTEEKMAMMEAELPEEDKDFLRGLFGGEHGNEMKDLSPEEKTKIGDIFEKVRIKENADSPVAMYESYQRRMVEIHGAEYGEKLTEEEKLEGEKLEGEADSYEKEEKIGAALTENKALKAKVSVMEAEMSRISKFCESASQHIRRLEENNEISDLKTKRLQNHATLSSQHIRRLEESADNTVRGKALKILQEDKTLTVFTEAAQKIVEKYPKLEKFVENHDVLFKFNKLEESNKQDVLRSIHLFEAKDVEDIINDMAKGKV